MPTTTERYRLGRDCTFAVDGVILAGVREVTTKRTTTEVDLTGYQHASHSTLVTHRTWEIEVAALRPVDAQRLREAEARQRVVTVTTTNGLHELSADFTVCESSSSEPLDDAVVATFTLKQWAHPKP